MVSSVRDVQLFVGILSERVFWKIPVLPTFLTNSAAVGDSHPQSLLPKKWTLNVAVIECKSACAVP